MFTKRYHKLPENFLLSLCSIVPLSTFLSVLIAVKSTVCLEKILKYSNFSKALQKISGANRKSNAREHKRLYPQREPIKDHGRSYMTANSK